MMKTLNYNHCLLFSFLFFGCSDPVTAVVAKTKSQKILDSFNVIDATMLKEDSASDQFHAKSMHKIDSFKRILDSLK
jgi:hypothetical protein